MAGHSPKHAVENFVSPLQRALSCVTTAVIDRQGEYELGVVYALTVNRGDPVRLARASGREHVAIRISQQYRVIRAEGERGPLKVEARAYMYTLEEAHGREILGYHWHPEGVSPFTMPHLHLSTGAEVGLPELEDAHLPTGRISVEQFLRFVIETFDVKARRRDWRRILRETHGSFAKWRTWA